MAFINQTYRIHYFAKGFLPGLTDVRMVVVKPNGLELGVYLLSEYMSVDLRGIYWYDFDDADTEGTYLFVISSVSQNKKDARQVYFEDANSIGWSSNEKAQIRDALGINGLKIASVGGLLQGVQSDISFIKDIEGGRWRIINNQMVFYKDDNVTEITRFDLYDLDGTPSNTNVFERRRI